MICKNGQPRPHTLFTQSLTHKNTPHTQPSHNNYQRPSPHNIKAIQVSQFQLQYHQETNQHQSSKPSQLYRNIEKIQKCKTDTQNLITSLYETITMLKADNNYLVDTLRKISENNRNLRSAGNKKNLVYRQLEEEKQFIERKLQKQIQKNEFLQRELDESIEERFQVERQYQQKLTQFSQQLSDKCEWGHSDYIKIDGDSTVL